ncbi:MAG: helix-turn-helix domain-containing protein [Actinomycetota bacterium]|nr:helix-turn-helix domain-containing protein [Actinomycetota bacterium]
MTESYQSLMTVKDVAKYLGLSERTIYGMIKRGEIPYVKAGRRYRFSQEKIEEWLRGESKAKEKEKLPEVLQRIKKIDDPLTKRLLFVGLLTRELKSEDIRPIIVGGNAVEFYTAGGYATYDIDVVAPSEPLDKILRNWGFEKVGRHWINEELDIIIEAPAFALDKKEQHEKLYEVEIDNLKVYILGIEDLIIDRLNAYVHWKSSDDGIWAKELAVLHSREIDWDYLEKRAKEEHVKAALDEIRDEIRSSN